MTPNKDACMCHRAVMDAALHFLQGWTSSLDRLAAALSDHGYDVRVLKTDRSKLMQVRNKGKHPFFFAIATSEIEILHTGRCELPI